VLGAHRSGEEVVVRAYRPDAERVSVVTGKGTEVELAPVHPGGIFEGTTKPGELPAHYVLRISYPGGFTAELVDPYSFLPTLGELDLHLAQQGRHELLYKKLGAQAREVDGVPGTSFSVWAPNARSISIVGDFNSWDGKLNPMRTLGSSGIWELFVPGVESGAYYKFEIRYRDGTIHLKIDPLAQATEEPPKTSSRVFASRHDWADADWLSAREQEQPLERPISIYEVHLGSWRQGLSYREAAEQLGGYVRELGFTHVELLPIMEHPFGGSWGYQVTGFFSPTARFGDPDDFRAFVDALHAQGIGVILDWVPAHFPRDDWALARFDGTALYEHADPRRGSHPDWGTFVFNTARNEVRNFLLASALLWLDSYHVDGLRLDAVASMLYLDYSRAAGQWVPNRYGGREDLDNIAFLRELNEVIFGIHPGVISAAEESTSWQGVSRPVYLGGLGFGFKWDMGWMHDTLGYFANDPVYRQYHHNELTFSMIYAYTENFVLPLSHDEVVHGKGSLYRKMPGDPWQKLANLRSLYGYMWAHPGKKLLFMGGELAQESEWNHDASLDWWLLDRPEHAGVQRLVRDLNAIYRAEPALYEADFQPHGFRWLDANDAARNIFSFVRYSGDGGRAVVCICNLSPVPRYAYRAGLPFAGRWREALNTDSEHYGGSNVGNYGGVDAEDSPWQGQPFSAELTLPPLGVVWLQPER
jgi:1,4-alpha-glucan branching enzyme